MGKLFYKIALRTILTISVFINFQVIVTKAVAIKQKEEYEVKFIAHRGLSSCAPENTLPAYILAGKNKFYACECDVQETKDNEFVLMHDDTIDRMTNGSGKVSDFTLKELRTLRIDAGSNIGKYENLKIPTLNEYLEICIKEKITPVIELKNLSKRSTKKLLNTIKKFDLEDKVIIISFNKIILENIRQRNLYIDLQWLADLNKENIDFCAKNKMNIDSEKGTVTKEMIKYAHDKGILVNVWTVDELEWINILINYKVDYITTNKVYNL